MRTLTILLLSAIALSALLFACGKETGQVQGADTIPQLVMQIQQCARLYTTEYRIHKVVTFSDETMVAGRLSVPFSFKLPGDRKILIPMEATLKGYIDFGTFSEQNVSREDGRIVITLPDPEIMLTSTKIDNEGIKDYVAWYRMDFTEQEKDAIERQGRQAIIDAVPQMGIDEAARLGATRVLVPLISQMGIPEQNIIIRFRRDFTIGNLPTIIKETGGGQ